MEQRQALELARETIRNEADALMALLPDLGEAFWTTCTLIAGCPGIVWITGVGTSAAMGSRFAHILTDCGVRSFFMSPDIGLHGHSGAMAPGEVLVAISRGGESGEVNSMATIGNSRGLETIAFAENLQSPLARTCRHVLPMRSPQEYEVGGYCATTSTVVCAAMCDAIAAVTLKLKGYTIEEFRGTHPGGAVGKSMNKPTPNPGDTA
jgi:arabinose-5-phosphate isomerase